MPRINSTVSIKLRYNVFDDDDYNYQEKTKRGEVTMSKTIAKRKRRDEDNFVKGENDINIYSS